jgi:hypothetical protein
MSAAGVSIAAAVAPPASRRSNGARRPVTNGAAAAPHASDSEDYQPAGEERQTMECMMCECLMCTQSGEATSAICSCTDFLMCPERGATSS